MQQGHEKTKNAESPNGWSDMEPNLNGEQNETWREKLEGLVEKATQLEDGFTISVGGEWEDAEGYQQSGTLVRNHYDKGTSYDTVTNDIYEAMDNVGTPYGFGVHVFSGDYKKPGVDKEAWIGYVEL